MQSLSKVFMTTQNLGGQCRRVQTMKQTVKFLNQSKTENKMYRALRSSSVQWTEFKAGDRVSEDSRELDPYYNQSSSILLRKVIFTMESRVVPEL